MYSGITRNSLSLSQPGILSAHRAVQAFMRKNGEFAKEILAKLSHASDVGISYASGDEQMAYVFGQLFCALTNQHVDDVRRISTAEFLHDLDRDMTDDENVHERFMRKAFSLFSDACSNYYGNKQGYAGTVFATLGNLGFTEASYNYAVALRTGTGAKEDIYASVDWLQNAVKAGLPIAMQNMGIHYFNGDGVECNRELGKKWVQKAVDAGFSHATKVLEKMNTTPEGQKLSSGCYVATAVYGSYDCPQVRVLRCYRDYRLGKSVFGRAFIRVYYCLSPTVVKWFGKKPWFNRFWRGILDRMVAGLVDLGIDDTPYEDRY